MKIISVWEFGVCCNSYDLVMTECYAKKIRGS